MDFTYKSYERLLDSILKAGYHVVTVRDYLQGDRKPLTLILRHDVEWSSQRALAIAKLEQSYGFRSTFCFRVDTKAFNLEIMRELQSKGFEVGYHFNTLDRCKGDFEKAIDLFERELRLLREAGIDVHTVCSHGDPRVKKVGYKVNNEIFLKDPGLRSRNKILGEAYLDIDFASLQYLSDAGVRWNKVSSTEELVSQISQKKWPTVYILVHPDYWSQSPLRAIALRAAAKCVRRLKINQAIILGKRVFAFPQHLVRRGHE